MLSWMLEYSSTYQSGERASVADDSIECVDGEEAVDDHGQLVGRAARGSSGDPPMFRVPTDQHPHVPGTIHS